MAEELALALILAAVSLTLFVRPREARGRSVAPPTRVPTRPDQAESAVRDQLYGEARSSDAVVPLRPRRRASRRRTSVPR